MQSSTTAGGEGAGAHDQPHIHKTLRWHHAVALVLGPTTGVFISMGFQIGAIGAWATIFIAGLMTLIAVAQGFLFAEMAAMFPDKPGGISLYAHEAWKKYFAPLGSLAAFGYWMGYSLVLAITGVIIGSLIQAQWFPDVTWTVSTGTVDLSLGHIIGLVTVALAWFLNVRGIKVAVRVNQIVGVVFVVVLAIIAFGPYFTGGWKASNLSWHVSGWKPFVVWMYVTAWTAYSSELCATFAPEFKDTIRDTRKALVTTGILLLAVFTLVPMGAAGYLGEQAIGENPLTYGVMVVNQLFGSGGQVITAAVVAAFFIGQICASADAARALFGLAKDDMTIKELYHLNRRGEPSRALTLDLVVNVLILLFVGNPLAILFASNLGYILSITLAVAGFLLLRRDRPAWPRPFRAGAGWVPAGVFLVAVNLVMLVVGALNPGLAGYGGIRESFIGLGILLVAWVLFAFRRIVQDRTGLRLREDAPALPTSEVADPSAL